MSSFAHRSGRIDFDDLMGQRDYRRWGAYKQSKLAGVLFTFELQRQFAQCRSNSIAVAAHPGVTFTGLGTEGNDVTNRLAAGFMKLSQPVSAAALPMLRAATQMDVRGGDFYGPRFRLAGAPVRETPSRRARNAADARRLWVVAASLVKQATDQL
jgi:protochlorophyllide reductase